MLYRSKRVTKALHWFLNDSLVNNYLFLIDFRIFLSFFFLIFLFCTGVIFKCEKIIQSIPKLYETGVFYKNRNEMDFDKTSIYFKKLRFFFIFIWYKFVRIY